MSHNTIPVSIKYLVNNFEYFVMKSKTPTVIRGIHGIGKSDIVRNICEKMGKTVLDRRASLMEKGDLIGLPSIKEIGIDNLVQMAVDNVEKFKNKDKLTWDELFEFMENADEYMPEADNDITNFNPPKWLKRACTEKDIVLLFEEVDRAHEVRNSLFELTGARKLYNNHLHPDTKIISCVNSGNGRKSYRTFDFDHAELDRWQVIDVYPDTEGWVTWAEDNDVNSTLISFMSENGREWLHKGEDFKPNEHHHTPRSWEKLDNHGAIEDFVKGNIDKSLFKNVATSFVGKAAAIKVSEYIDNKIKITLEDVYKGNFDIDEEINVDQAMKVLNEMDNRDRQPQTNQELRNYGKFICVAPDEQTLLLFDMLSQEKKKQMRDEVDEDFVPEHIQEKIRDFYSESKETAEHLDINLENPEFGEYLLFFQNTREAVENQQERLASQNDSSEDESQNEESVSEEDSE